MPAPAPDTPLLVAPSLLSCDFARLGDELRRAEDAGADWHHVDVMDGHFVPNLTIGPPVVRRIRAAATKPLDVHLMVTDPKAWAEPFADAGAHGLTFHAEAVASEREAREVVAAFRNAGAEVVGASLNPDTPLERVLDLLDAIDLVLVMSVFPGFGGQEFLPDVLEKTARLRELGWTGYLEMDGGLNVETAPRCVEAGADVLVAGSALYGAEDMASTLSAFRDAAERARR